MFEHLDSDCPYDEWRDIAAGLKDAKVVKENGEPDDCFDLFKFFDYWSSKGLKYEGGADCLKLWKSLKPKDKKPGGIGFGTVIFLARRGGYKGTTVTPDFLFGDLQLTTSVSDRLAEMSVPGRLAQINDRYAMVESGPNASKIVDLTDPRAPRFMDVKALATIYANRPIIKVDDGGKETKINPATLWVASPTRRSINGIVFEPSGSPHPIPKGAHNTWQGPLIEPLCNPCL